MGSSTLHNIWKSGSYRPKFHIDFDIIIGESWMIDCKIIRFNSFFCWLADSFLIFFASKSHTGMYRYCRWFFFIDWLALTFFFAGFDWLIAQVVLFDVLHDFRCVGGRIHDVHYAFMAQYAEIETPMDVVLACGVNNIPTTDTAEERKSQTCIKDFWRILYFCFFRGFIEN